MFEGRNAEREVRRNLRMQDQRRRWEVRPLQRRILRSTRSKRWWLLGNIAIIQITFTLLLSLLSDILIYE